MDKFTNNVSVEEDPNYQAWLDAQEVADIRVMEAEALARTRAAARRQFVADAFAPLIAKTAKGWN
jgi:hypothetical protein